MENVTIKRHEGEEQEESRKGNLEIEKLKREKERKWSMERCLQ